MKELAIVCALALLHVMQSLSGAVYYETSKLSATLEAKAPSVTSEIEKKQMASTTAPLMKKVPKKIVTKTKVPEKPKVVSIQVEKPAATLALPAEPLIPPVAVTTPAPQETPITDDFVSQVEQQLLVLQNVERVKNGFSALTYDSTLSNVARAHSTDMAAHSFFGHTNSQGCSSSCRITNAGYTWSAVGENIYEMSGYELSASATAQMMVNGWMNSPGHRANILNNSFTNAGVGVAKVGIGIYATVDFAKPR